MSIESSICYDRVVQWCEERRIYYKERPSGSANEAIRDCAKAEAFEEVIRRFKGDE
jgi:hypothetical protein